MAKVHSDATYPDPAAGGYKKQDCGRYTPASVISTSYGSNEASMTAAYEMRQCNEYATSKYTFDIITSLTHLSSKDT